MHEQVDEAIRVFDKLLLVLSPDSINSKWVRDEIAEHEGPRSGTVGGSFSRSVSWISEHFEKWENFYADLAEDVAQEIREYFIPDFSKWRDHDAFEGAFARLLKDLKTEASTGPKPI